MLRIANRLRVLKISILPFFLLQVITVGCKPIYEVSKKSYIIDSNDIQIVDESNYDNIDPIQLNSAVLITTTVGNSKRKFCSGTIIQGEDSNSNYRVITNLHCFFAGEPTQSLEENDEGPAFVDERCESTKVFYKFYKDQISQPVFGKCEIGTLKSNYQGDLAVFTLEQNPNLEVSPAEFWPTEDVPSERMARIIHFPNIDSNESGSNESLVYVESVGINLPVGQVTSNNCITKGRFPASEWPLDKSLSMGIRHTCDQKKGSSGSALWDIETNRIIGINWGGITLTYQNPSRSETYNVATRSTYVKAFLENTLSSEIDKMQNSADSQGAKNATVEKTGANSCSSIGSPLTSYGIIILFIMFLLPPTLCFASSKETKSSLNSITENSVSEKVGSWIYLQSLIFKYQNLWHRSTVLNNQKEFFQNRETWPMLAQSMYAVRQISQSNSPLILSDKLKSTMALHASHLPLIEKKRFKEIGKSKSTLISDLKSHQPQYAEIISPYITRPNIKICQSKKVQDTLKLISQISESSQKSDLTKDLQTWSETDLICLSQSIIKTRDSDKRNFLNNIFWHIPIMTKSRDIQSMVALSHLQSKDYPNCLRILFDLQQGSAEYRAIYNTVQQVYGLSHQGSGQVGLKGSAG